MIVITVVRKDGTSHTYESSDMKIDSQSGALIVFKPGGRLAYSKSQARPKVLALYREWEYAFRHEAT